MPSEFPMNDPQNIWQTQPTEAFKMSADQLRHKAQQRERKSRFEAVYSTIIGLALFVFFAWGCARTHALIPRIGFGVLSLWCAYFANKSCKGILRKRLAPDATLDITARSYRTELEKRHDFGRRVWLTLTPVFLGMAMVHRAGTASVALRPATVVEFGAVFALLGIWLAIFVPKRRRGQQKLQQEIEQLRVFEREYQA